MSDFNETIKHALEKNGTLDPEKARQIRDQATGQFARALRKMERTMCRWLVGLNLIAVIAFLNLFQSSSTKYQILYAIMALIAVEGTVLMKLWYWSMNSRTVLLKEIRLLRLGVADDTETMARAPMSMALSRRERSIWMFFCLVPWAAVVFLVIYGNECWSTASRTIQRIAINADGSGTRVLYTSYPVRTMQPAMDFTIYDGKYATGITPKWFDAQGRELERTITEEGPNSLYRIHLFEPVMPGQWLSYRCEETWKEIATRDRDGWLYQTSWYAKGTTPQFIGTVTLPEGAIVDSVTPRPDEQSVADGHPVIRLDSRTAKDEKFQCQIRYRLPGQDASGAEAGKPTSE